MAWQTVLPHGFGRSACLETVAEAEKLRAMQQRDIEFFHRDDKAPKRVQTRIVKHANDCYAVEIRVDRAK